MSKTNSPGSVDCPGRGPSLWRPLPQGPVAGRAGCSCDCPRRSGHPSWPGVVDCPRPVWCLLAQGPLSRAAITFLRPLSLRHGHDAAPSSAGQRPSPSLAARSLPRAALPRGHYLEWLCAMPGVRRTAARPGHTAGGCLLILAHGVRRTAARRGQRWAAASFTIRQGRGPRGAPRPPTGAATGPAGRSTTGPQIPPVRLGSR